MMTERRRCKKCGGLVKWIRLDAETKKSLCLGCGKTNGPLMTVVCQRLKEISWCWTSKDKNKNLNITMQAINIYEAYKQLNDWQKQKIRLNKNWIEIDGKRI